MTVPFPLSDGFSEYIQSLEDRIEELRRTLDQTTANLGYLGDRLAAPAGLSTFMLPAPVLSGNKFSAEVQFRGKFNPNNWGVDFFGPDLDFLANIDEEEVFTVGNILNGFGERDETNTRIFHGLLLDQINGELNEEDASNSCIPVFFYPGLRNLNPWEGLQEGQTDPGVNRIAGIPVLTYFKPDVQAVCD